MPQNLNAWPWKSGARPLLRATLAGLAHAAAGGCARSTPDAAPAPSGQADAASASAGAEAGYVQPPRPTRAARAGAGGVTIAGLADPQDRIRLSAPGGEAFGGAADGAGRWAITVPMQGQVRLFGVAEELAGRAVQAEGYVAVTPSPGQPAVLLRAGVGAQALAPPPAHPRLTAVDCDGAGWVVISGLARPGATLHLTIDGGGGGDAQADGAGRFSITPGAAMGAGDHVAVLQSGGDLERLMFTIDAPTPVSGAPFRGRRQADRWRIDWATPGGGLQTTYVLD
jgi:hypothetical protein